LSFVTIAPLITLVRAPSTGTMAIAAAISNSLARLMISI
jgi:hypothetical protein